MKEQKIQLTIDGMTCQSCASRIEKVLNRHQAIQQADVNFAAEEANITWDAEKIDEKQLITLIEKTGFCARPKTDDTLKPSEYHASWRLWLILLCAIPFIWGMIGMMIGQHTWMIPPTWQAILATIVQLGLALPFYRSAYAALRNRAANMDVLVVLGTTTIWLYSLITHFSGSPSNTPHIYFEASVMVIAFVSLGKYWEMRAKKGSLNSIGELINLTPPTAEAWLNDQWQTIPYNDIQLDMQIKVRQGERVCADGIVIEGEAWAEESHLTGEPHTLHKTQGQTVLAGSLISEGSLIFRSQALGQDTLLGDMMQALSEAQGSKAPIARLADKVAAVFVPIVVSIALLTFLITLIITGSLNQALMHAVSVLVIACPCALGLATPAAIMVGMGVAARKGVWFKDAAAMEETAHIDTVVLDKTGTLTQGRPQIVAIWQPENSPYTTSTLWQAVLSLETHSTHPLAKTLVQAALAQNTQTHTATDINNQIGQGISGQIDNIGQVRIGSSTFCDIHIPPQTDKIWQIATIVAISINNQAAGAFALSDALRPDSLQAIKQLQKKNIAIHIMSGDQKPVLNYLAQQLGLPESHVHGEMSPRDKANAVTQLRQTGAIVAMVGDGVNDTPALVAANIGFAMRSGTDIANQTADATLMRHSITQVYDALSSAQATLKNIRQNLFFAFIYNILGIPLAALGLLNPMIAGAAMALSSISVLGNALRLRKQ